MNIDMDKVVHEVTNDWVSTFEKLGNQNGFMWYAAGQGILPLGVDTNDERVIALCKKAAQSIDDNTKESN